MTALRELPNDALEVVACGLCGKRDAEKRFVVRGFPILACQSCGLSYVSPRLNISKLNELYSQEKYFKSDNSLVCGYVDYISDKDNILATFKKRFDWLLDASGRNAPGRILDVGCATGFSLEYALSQGWDPYGVELSSFAAQQARRKFGDRVRHGTLAASGFPKNHFDTILIWDVIEHVPDPLQTLRELNDLLAPGGFMSLITPDCGSFLAKIMRSHWMEYAKPTEHIYFFSQKTLTTALKKTDFNLIAATTAGKYVGLDFLVDRFCAYFPIARGLKRNPLIQKALLHPIYIDPGDKMMILAVKKKDSR